MNNLPKTIMCGVRTIQPYFILSTSSMYEIKVIADSPISHFYSFVADRSDGQVFAVPDASVDILFLCDGERTKARLCGTTTTAKLVEIQQGKYYFGIRFRPGYIPDFINENSKDLIDQEFALQDIMPNVDDLLVQIASTQDFEYQIQLFFAHFEQKIRYKNSIFATQVRDLITKNHGDMRIADLERYTGYSSRYISKVFTENFGLSPKSYALILRFQYILQRMILDHELSLTNLASEQGYADQSHFLREFKRFAAQSPSRFVQAIKNNQGRDRLYIDDEILALRQLH
ncbi:helix-turn-helix domain-containing protein [Wohlfahrtiimonas chitiniclastica]|uniref:helix-turn-helix domain-containing protein n=1 Tax=Wohlfahrtiimonas chitiniclastica TaxID=400946 RepID=UPI001BCF68F3|nr:AraC family transcriptional regulator [Wohlfahrtiimonas chitiniclastica]MBS7838413.1 helix-turn-helix transcriptional regulator [Wohlfahrtiimonas chitiniclastica]